MPKKRQRIVSYDELLARNPTQAQLDAYWPLLRQLQAMGYVDDDLNVRPRAQAPIIGPVRAGVRAREGA